MIAGLLTAASNLDGWLHKRLGRPYGVVLSVGLVIEIIRKVAETPERLTHARGLAALAALILLNAALLVHQLGELSERLGRERPATTE
jgi:hypothetical protein